MLEKVPDSGDLASKGAAEGAITDVEKHPHALKIGRKDDVHSRQDSLTKIIRAGLQAILVIAMLIGSYALTQKMIDDKPEPQKRRAFKSVYTIETVIVKQADIQPIFTAYGQTLAARSVDLRALVSGEIINLNPKLGAGAFVKKGEALIEIDSFNYAGALSEAVANLDEAKARIVEGEAQIVLEQGKFAAAQEQLIISVADLARAKKLKKRGNTTQKEVDNRKLVESQRKQAALLSKDTIKIQQSRLTQLKATVQRLEWRVKQAQRNLDSTTLVAPFDGIVKTSTAEMGRVITANDVVVSMYEAGTLEVKFTLTDSQYGRLQISKGKLIGRDVTVVWTVGGKEYLYPAKVDRVGAEISSTRGGVEIIAKVDRSENAVTIRPGAFVEVRVPDQLFNAAMSIPDTSVYGENSVYVESDGMLKKKTVNIVAYDGEQVIISSGLETGDKVLTTRITEVSEGLRVRREGDPVPQRGKSQDGKPAAKGEVKTGPPSPEEISEIVERNGLSLAEFRALSSEEKRNLIKTHRAKAAE